MTTAPDLVPGEAARLSRPLELNVALFAHRRLLDSFHLALEAAEFRRSLFVAAN